MIGILAKGIHRGKTPRLILMTDAARLPDPRPLVARLPRGAAVLLRHYDDPGRAELARDLRILCRKHGLSLIVAADPALAAAVDADGLHLPQGLAQHAVLHRALAWRRGKPGRLLTCAAHDPAGLARAARLGADACLISPIFATPSHPDARPLGPIRLALWRRRYGAGMAAIALGGVAPSTVKRLRGSGCHGVAGIGGAVELGYFF